MTQQKATQKAYNKINRLTKLSVKFKERGLRGDRELKIRALKAIVS